jgi:hypothetical protein
MLHRLFDQPSAATVTLARIHEPFEPSLFFCTIERGEVRVTSVNDGRKLTPWRRVKTDPSAGHESSVVAAGTRPRSRSLSR